MLSWVKDISSAFHKAHLGRAPYVCRKEIFALVSTCVNLLYPSRCEDLKDEKDDWSQLIIDIYDALARILKEMEIAGAEDKAKVFVEQLPKVKELLDQDAEFFAEADPASESVAEVILCYPGFYGMVVHRLAHELYQLDIPMLPRIISEHAHEKTGIDIHPGAQIQSPVFIDHGTGIVIGETCRIGHHVKIFQGVTLGAPSVHKKLKGKQRHPIVGDHVILYANATILGGSTKIGDRSIVGGNVWLTSSVPEDSECYYEASVKHR